MDLNDFTPCDFVAIGEILGNIISMNLPLNTQNSLGNWLCLVGQVICTYNAQQELYNDGPGVCFDVCDKWPYNQQTSSSQEEAQPIKNAQERANNQNASAANKKDEKGEKEIKPKGERPNENKKVSAENIKEFMDMCEKNAQDIETIKSSLGELNQNINEIMMILYKKYGKS